MGLDCCVPPAECEGFYESASKLDELADDPTLQDCCRRDLQEQAQVARLKAELTLHDPTLARLRLARQTISSRPPNKHLNRQDSHLQHHPEAEDEDQDADDDYMLQKLRKTRLQQLQQASSATRTTTPAATRLHSSFQAGTLVDATISELADFLELSSSSSTTAIKTTTAIVCHFALEGSPIDDQADELLLSLAHQHPKTHFLRVMLPRHGFSTSGGGGGENIGLPPGHSGVMCCSGDSIITAPLSLFFSVDSDEEEEEDLDDEALERWLEKQGVLLVSDGGNDNSVGSREEEGGEEDEEDKYEPCEVCGRCYPHQHVVRSVTRGGTDGVL